MDNSRVCIHKQWIEKGLIIIDCTALGFFVLLCLLSIHFVLYPPVCNAFNSEIKYLDMIKTYRDNISLKSPTDVYVDGKGDLYILDSGLQTIFIFDKSLMPISAIGKTHGIKSPICMAVDNEGLIYISEEVTADTHKGRITVLDSLGRQKKRIVFEAGEWAKDFIAQDIAIDEEGKLYLAGGSSKSLVILSKEGKFLSTIHPMEKDKDGKQIRADVIGVALRGEFIYLLSEWQGHVYVYNSQGDQLNIFGMKGGSTAKLSRPQALAVDVVQGVSYVIDYMRHTLLIYDASGSFINEFGGLGWGPGWFNFPKDVCVDNQGRLFVADTFNHRVQVFRYNYP